MLAPLTSLLLLSVLCLATPAEADTDFSKPLWNATYTDLLKRDLLTTYDKFARPSQHGNTTKVTLNLVLKHVHLDDRKSLMTVNAWVHLAWKDEKLRWNASDYGGLKTLHLADHEIWEPDIVLYNSALGNNIDHYGNTHCLAQPDGQVLWVPPSQFVVFCDLDLLKWPFDRHTCSLRLGSWTYSGEQVDLQINQSDLQDVHMNVETIEWTVVNVTKRRYVTYYACCNEPYIDVDFRITVERRSPAYRAVVIMPAISMILLTLASFWLPSQGRERYMMTSLNAVLVAIFLIYFTIRLPIVGPSTPLIVLFYAYNLIMVCVSMVLSVIFYNLSTSQIRLPRLVINILRGPLSKILFLATPKPKVNYNQHGYEEDGGVVGEELREYESEQEDRRMLNRKGPQEGWILATSAVDRIVFIIYLLLFSSFAIRSVL